MKTRHTIFLLTMLVIAGCATPAITLKDLATPGEFPPLHNDPGRRAPREIVYKSVDGTELRVFVFMPDDHTPDCSRPAVLCIHGGSWVGGEATFFFPHARYFAERGMVAISVEYRLSGRNGVTIFDCLQDVRSAMRYIRTNADDLGIDPDRIAALGDSAGGHLAASLGLIDGFDEQDAGAPVSARPNLMLLYNPSLDLPALRWTHGHYGIAVPNPDSPGEPSLENVQAYGETPEARGRAISPMFHIAPDQPPVFLMHGDADNVVSIEQAERFARLYEAAGNQCEFIPLEGIAHAFVLVNYTAPEPVIIDAIRAADRFLAAHGYLEGKPTLRQ